MSDPLTVVAATRTRRWALGTLLAASAVSLAGNVQHELSVYNATTPLWFAVAWAAVPPLALPLAVHLAGLMATGSTRGRRTLATAVSAVAAIAFTISFINLHALTAAMGAPAVTAVLFPLLVDLLAGISTVALLMRESATDSPADSPAHTDDALDAPADAGPAYPAGLAWLTHAGPATGDIDVAVETAPEPVTSSEDAGASANESREQRAWRMHMRGDSQPTIAAALACSQSTVSRMLKRMADAEAAAASAAA